MTELDRLLESLATGERQKLADEPPPSKADIEALVESSGLTPAQTRAAILLATGASVASVAKAAKVARPTVSDWLHHHDGFRQLYFQLVSDQRDELRQATLRLARMAISALESFLSLPMAHPAATGRAAHLVLKAAGIIEVDLPPAGDGCTIEASAIVADRHPPDGGAVPPLINNGQLPVLNSCETLAEAAAAIPDATE